MTEYAYNEAGQLKERRWAREGSPQRSQRGTEAEGSAGTPARTDGRLATLYEYDPTTLQLAKSTATDGSVVGYEYDPEGRFAKVTDATGTREFAYDLRGQVVKETVVLQPDPEADPIRYEIRRSYTALGQPESVHLVGADGQSVALDHRIDYAWNEHGQLASVKSLAGEFAYGYDASNPALLTKMTGPAHSVETSYEPHRNLITGVVNRSRVAAEIGSRKSEVGRDAGAPGISTPAADSGPSTKHDGPSTKHDGPSTLSSYVYANDLLGRRETISQGGEAFGMLKLGENRVEVAYNDRSEVVGSADYSSVSSGINGSIARIAIIRETGVEGKVGVNIPRNVKPLPLEASGRVKHYSAKVHIVVACCKCNRTGRDVSINEEDARKVFSFN